MAERTGSGRDRLARAKRAQSQKAALETAEQGDEGAAPDRGGHFGNLAVRAAALIAGSADPGASGPEDEEGDEDDGGDARPAEGDKGKPATTDGQGEPDEGDEDEGEGSQAAQVSTIDDAAKALGLSRSEFNALEVKVGNETMTLGELKAKLPEVLKLDKSRTEFDDARGQWELERIASYRNIHAIVDAIPKTAQTAELLRQLESRHQEIRQRELETLHFARPQWSDPHYATAAREKILAIGKEYGFSRAEIDALMDHRQVLLVQDFADLRDKVRASRDTARKLAEPSGARPSGQAGAAGRDVSPSSNGSGRDRRPHKLTREATAAHAGAILRKR